MEEYRVKVYSNGAEWYNLKGQRHRTDGPAIEHANGTKYWYFNGKLHRTDGPAIEWADGTKFWWVEGKEITYAKFDEYVQKFVKQRQQSCDGKIVD